jgi:hypothetical protein
VCNASSEQIAFNYGRSSPNVCVDRKITIPEAFKLATAPSIRAVDATAEQPAAQDRRFDVVNARPTDLNPVPVVHHHHTH